MGARVAAHRLVMRVIREGLIRQDRLPEACDAAAALLSAHIPPEPQDRPALRDFAGEVTALTEAAASIPGVRSGALDLMVAGAPAPGE